MVDEWFEDNYLYFLQVKILTIFFIKFIYRLIIVKNYSS